MTVIEAASAAVRAQALSAPATGGTRMLTTIRRLFRPSSGPPDPDRPGWVTSPAADHCALCGRWVARGAPALWLPLSTQRFCRPCGQTYLRSSGSAPLAA